MMDVLETVTTSAECGVGGCGTLKDTWLNWSNDTNTTTGTTSTGCYDRFYWQPYNYQWYSPYNVYSSPPIKLKLSEIEKLRRVAKDNKDIKDILNKFTSYITVEVDF